MFFVCRKIVEELQLETENIELSMGMSNDYEEAIKMGSTNIRVGSSIFGARNYGPSKTEDSIVTLSQELQATQISK